MFVEFMGTCTRARGLWTVFSLVIAKLVLQRRDDDTWPRSWLGSSGPLGSCWRTWRIAVGIVFDKMLNIPFTNNLKEIKGKRVLFLDFPDKEVDVEDSMFFKCHRLLDQTL